MDLDEAIRLLRGGWAGIAEWNRRFAGDESLPRLIDADLSSASLVWAVMIGQDLSGANFNGADLSAATLPTAILAGTDLQNAKLTMANLNNVDLRGANLRRADASMVSLFNARLNGADLRMASFLASDLTGANFTGANLNGANLMKANLNGADLTDADLSDTYLDETIFANVDLSVARGLEACNHQGPSSIDYQTLQRSGPLPLAFLRGCGLTDLFIESIPALFHGSAIEFYSCFISYSSEDHAFAARLHADLQENGVRCWFAPEDMRIGDKIRQRIDESIRVYDKLLLILSDSSVQSKWVEKEVETAFDKEHRRNEPALFPVRLDDAVMKTDHAWAADIRRTRHIGDFRDWKQHDNYNGALERLLRDLKVQPRPSES